MTNATLGFIEEMNAQASISALKDGMIRKLPVKRDGKFTPLNVVDVVPGDVVPNVEWTMAQRCRWEDSCRASRWRGART